LLDNLKISIIIPCYNEINNLEKIIKKIHEQKNIKKEIILVDDFSNDGSRELIKKFLYKKVKKVIYHKKNLGKGACIKSALKNLNGDIVLIQDADLEYNPSDYKKLIAPIIKKKTLVVYGSRVLNKDRYKTRGFTSLFRIFANHVLTIISNIINNQSLTDAHTCYKVFHKDVLLNLKLKENDFSFCPELTTKISKLNIKIIEVPIKYNGRSYKEGKKINFYDAIKALIVLLKYRFIND
jgi:glycosyltransferase involved in cell wall biosynthesis